MYVCIHAFSLFVALMFLGLYSISMLANLQGWLTISMSKLSLLTARNFIV